MANNVRVIFMALVSSVNEIVFIKEVKPMKEYGKKLWECEDCGNPIKVIKSRPEYSITDDGKLVCGPCGKKRKISSMEKTFDTPIHR
jgi:formylmethanofuran dehydrogenase subunit E